MTEVKVKMSNREKSMYASELSKFNLQELVLELAEFYRNFDKIYFPLRMDQRGRIYCSPNYLNYQGSELAKSLWLFAEPSIITKEAKSLYNIKYLEFYGVNCFGKDKLSDEAKLKWIKSNLNDIINYANGILLLQAKDKLLFLSFCIEYKRYINFFNDENAYEFHTYLPIQLDATCNGFQHLALLSNENILFKELNLTVTGDRPNDFYSFLIHRLDNKFNNEIEKGNKIENEGSYVRLVDFIFTRSNVKKAIMTIPYNATPRSMRKYLVSEMEFVRNADKLSWYSQKDDQKQINLINNKDITLLMDVIQHIINNDFEKIKKLIKYLANIATALTLLGLPIVWFLPHGLVVRQSYLEVKSTSIRPFVYSKAKINIQVVNKDALDKLKQIRAFMPNLIHSLDASSMSLLYNKFHLMYKQPQFFSIHDCFGTTLDKVDLLKTMLASVYMDIYSHDHYLGEFDRKILKYIELQTGNVIDRNTRLLEINIKGRTTQYELHNIKWVTNEIDVKNSIIKRIDSQHILI